ncbi:MAG TPA: UDP-N-acetylmuramoyl-tripeptide--D-alanyl-D-alanine ligase [Candidatus Deferrimicrobiaceae bacterium]|nr:UDP-N-acetylmuramoyl-tripeptide--D-alanyl-D-alanine ligase [Candidatus Deferrimicrobiaceae bacterium]
MTLGEVIGVLHPLRGGGQISTRDPIGPVTTDSREVTPGGVFVALPGERVDGADFVEEAIRKGARAAIVSEEGARKVPSEVLAGKPVFVVRNPVEALGDLARAHRERFRHIPLVGISGSSGKTSTKELLAALLSRSKEVLKNPGNRNNLIGLPLALLTLSGDHDVAVLEMATNQPGEIARLASIAAPDVAVLTNIAPAHLKGLGSLEGVAREKGDLYRSLPESGTAVVNATDLRVMREAGRCRAAKIHYGVALNEISGRVVFMDDEGMRIAVRTPSGEFASSLRLTGEHNLMNALAAVAAAYALGLRPADMEEGFRSVAPGRGRFRPVPLRGGGLLLDDTYNANPASVEAALRNLVALRRGRRCIVVLADMLELGEASGSSHFRIGHMVGGIKPDLLFTHGTEAAAIAGGAREGGLDPGRIMHVGERDALRGAVTAALREGDVILVKGSRGMRLEEIAEAVEKEWA